MRYMHTVKINASLNYSVIQFSKMRVKFPVLQISAILTNTTFLFCNHVLLNSKPFNTENVKMIYRANLCFVIKENKYKNK